MNPTFQPILNKYVAIYFDNILVYNKSMDDHIQYVQSILDTLRGQKLFGNMRKCHFMTNEIKFLGFIISAKGVAVNSGKVDAIANWPIPKTFIEVRKFHGLNIF